MKDKTPIIWIVLGLMLIGYSFDRVTITKLRERVAALEAEKGNLESRFNEFHQKQRFFESILGYVAAEKLKAEEKNGR